jgi:hypothetical protein
MAIQNRQICPQTKKVSSMGFYGASLLTNQSPSETLNRVPRRAKPVDGAIRPKSDPLPLVNVCRWSDHQHTMRDSMTFNREVGGSGEKSGNLSLGILVRMPYRVSFGCALDCGDALTKAAVGHAERSQRF